MTPAEQNGHADAEVLRWTGKLLSAEDLRRHLNGQRELIVQRHAIVTPLAIDELRQQGVRLLRDDTTRSASEAISTPTRNVGSAASVVHGAKRTGYAQERPSPLVTSAVHSLQREGMALKLMDDCKDSCCQWAQTLSECVMRGDCSAAVVFCADPGIVCCVANKIAGLRAVSVQTAAQAARAQTNIGANLLAVEMPGRTFFEIRQILLNLCRSNNGCPEKVAQTLKELDGHAHR